MLVVNDWEDLMTLLGGGHRSSYNAGSSSFHGYDDPSLADSSLASRGVCNHFVFEREDGRKKHASI